MLDDPDFPEGTEVVGFFSERNGAATEAAVRGLPVREWDDPYGVSFHREATRRSWPDLYRHGNGDLLVQRVLVPLMDPSWSVEPVEPKGVVFFASEGPANSDFLGLLREQHIEIALVDDPWVSAINDVGSTFSCDAAVTLESFFESQFGQQRSLFPQLSGPSKNGLLWIFPGSEWGLVAFPEAYELYYRRLFQFVRSWEVAGRVNCTAFCLNQVSDRGDESGAAMEGFMRWRRSLLHRSQS